MHAFQNLKHCDWLYVVVTHQVPSDLKIPTWSNMSFTQAVKPSSRSGWMFYIQVGFGRRSWRSPFSPVVDQEVIRRAAQRLPHVSLKRTLLVHLYTGGRSPLQLPVHGSGMSLSLVHYHVGDFCDVAALQPPLQDSHSAERQTGASRQG